MKLRHFMKEEMKKMFVTSFLITILVFATLLHGIESYAATSTTTLTASVQAALTFTTTSSFFGNVTPGTIAWATTTLDVATNNVNGWFVALSGDNKTGSANNFQSGANSITDQTEWVPGSATTTTGNAAVRASLINSGNVLAFRVMTASSSNGTAFTSSSWWGTTDADGTAKFAGIASSTVSRQIGNAGVGSYSASNHLNTVQYYLNVAATQPTGSYSAPLTYTATVNP